MSPPPLADRLKHEKPPRGEWIVWVGSPMIATVVAAVPTVLFFVPVWFLTAPLWVNFIVPLLRTYVSGDIQRDFGPVILTLVASSVLLAALAVPLMWPLLYLQLFLLPVYIPIACGIHWVFTLPSEP